MWKQFIEAARFRPGEKYRLILEIHAGPSRGLDSGGEGALPGESPKLSRPGTPRHHGERLQHIVNWFDKYLLGKPAGMYDVA